MNKLNYSIITETDIKKYKKLQQSIETIMKNSKRNNYSNILINWTEGKIIPLHYGNKQDTILEVEKNETSKCTKCKLKGLYKINNKYYCWSHVYLQNILNNIIEKN